MSAAEAVGRDRIAELDDTLVGRPDPLLTLHPDRPRARLPSEQLEAVLEPDDPPSFAGAVASGVAQVYDAILRAFPSNLLWDLDGLFGTVVQAARGSGDPATTVAQTMAVVAGLQDTFGRGPINFRYIHDFVYGFDWAKWVRKDPEHRRDVGPYDPEFLAAMQARGQELLDVIARDADEKYPPLRGPEARNPFGFSREPADEITLHSALARRGLIPVRAWTRQAAATWDRDFAHLRSDVAAELGLSR